MAKFKIGDKVQYIRGEKLQGKHQYGVIYTVSAVESTDFDEYIHFVEAPNVVLAKRLTKATPPSRHRFIAGQSVVCVDTELLGPRAALTKGKRYGVRRVNPTSGRVCIEDDRGTLRYFTTERFMDADAYDFKKAQDRLDRFGPGEVIPVPAGMVAGQMLFRAVPTQSPKLALLAKRKTPRSIKIDPVDAKAALTKMLKEVYGIDATVEQVIGAMDKSLELVLGA